VIGPGVDAVSINGLSSLSHEDITISECCGIFRLQFTGSLKSSKFSSKTIVVEKRIVTFIQKIKRSDGGKLFGKLKVNLAIDSRMFSRVRNLFPTFEFGMVRKVAIIQEVRLIPIGDVFHVSDQRSALCFLPNIIFYGKIKKQYLQR
jgi:hypothetical protein